MKKRNYWKYAFIALVAVLVVGLGILGTKVFSSPSETYQVSSKIESQNNKVFSVDMDKEEANKMAQYYLKNTLNDGKTEYQLKLKSDAELTGAIAFLGSKIHFTLVMSPFAKTNGDVLLKAKAIKIGDLSLPISFVMNYINNSFKVPEWVSVNSKDKTILLKFTKFTTKEGYGIRAKKIDLKNNILKFDIMNEKITSKQ
ncbi:YpmS family protein [Companilactobacillus nodensis]|uniref:Extracellular protein n=1 Tax=Companilactobacillus nodensis DSM 19682 = JCM 14932 = NBRC 107160 TaxID=1423775 RepID=A0A0R1KGA9_9LACO|nr:YpmS family protein [Companilactobacillus nodensis]KRK80563.1 extracellular protein precursor [Companilactobacillus nodensis DSM 19682 = JCM 14932 = NBRC 107160]